MDLNRKLPEEIAERLREQLGPDEQIRYCLASDLTLERHFGEAYIAVTDRKVAVCDSESHHCTLELAEIDEVRVDELFGSGRLLAVMGGRETALIYYSKVCVPQFAVLCRVIADLAGGRQPHLPDDQERAYCPRCGAPLPERGESCPVCVPRLKILLRLLGVVRPYRFKFALLVAMTFVTVTARNTPPLICKQIMDDVIEPMNAAPLPWLIGAMLACAVVMFGAGYSSGRLISWLAARVVADLRNRLHAHLQRLQLNYFNRREPGQLVARVMHDTERLQGFLVDGLPWLLVHSVSFVAIAGVLLYLDWRLALLVFLPVPFLVGGGAWFFRRLTPLFHKYGSGTGVLHTILGESIRGIKAIKAHSQEERRTDQFHRPNESLFQVGYAIDRTFFGFFESMGFVMAVGTTAVWYLAARRLALGDPTVTKGLLIAFVGFAALFYMPLRWFGAVMNWLTRATAGAERIFSVLDSEPEVYDSPNAIAIPEMAGAISFRDVRFSYERGKEVIRGMSFDIAAGEMVGLVGKSGAGKSTIINLICRFFDADSGLITIDGHPIKEVKLTQLRTQIGMVMQEPFLFNATILDNIRYGKPEATFEEVVLAARAANAHDFILDKEDGYDTVIGEGAASVSGGEQQRLAIARAVLHDPAILILDEATSSVDSETERAIQEAIANLIEGRTTIAIAHRLATLRNADRLIVIDDGRIAEMGTHDELLTNGGTYARLVEIQSELSQLRQNLRTE
ncbi:MAG: ABC transporter ATP-binding protein [Planctomycetota bacterium]|jgi:ATP-binding cassette subfamily B protein